LRFIHESFKKNITFQKPKSKAIIFCIGLKQVKLGAYFDKMKRGFPIFPIQVL
jgi:hypothetical protein